ncbi:MAG: 30S ribosomal protein S13 [Candidatus Moranbacteria bacterium GW2011_GWE1_49_15]|nr:MAG: 30S ribosomal protein S13 [Candidatus Moranbacteria bacterium GW2011_GWE2_47_10]KKW07599.1 MAG: 30S ribosomal protein S13 [Candidatus Moranbacteria bacterium GW2011_GWE1_49_15]HBP01067.1 30S ribosomal protein S13 [Candidatus Moranbacteria bacterium]
MIRIAGINLPDEKKIKVALTYVYGIGPTTSEKILEKVGIDKETRTKDVNSEDAAKLRDEIEKKYKVEGELKHEVKMNVKRLKEIGCHRGVRHQKGLPVRGQRTKTNSRTVRGNTRKTMGSGRKSVEKT